MTKTTIPKSKSKTKKRHSYKHNTTVKKLRNTGNRLYNYIRQKRSNRSFMSTDSNDLMRIPPPLNYPLNPLYNNNRNSSTSNISIDPFGTFIQEPINSPKVIRLRTLSSSSSSSKTKKRRRL